MPNPHPSTALRDPADATGRVLARALIGWLDSDEAARWLSGNEFQPSRDPRHLELVRRAKASIAARAAYEAPPFAGDRLPEELEHHLGLLRTHPESAGTVAKLGEARIVDLSRIVAAQKQILVADAEDRVRGASAGDPGGLARITLPLPRREPISWKFDGQRNAFVLTSPNPNLSVTGHFNSTVGGEMPGIVFDGFGFAVSYQRSYLQVAVIGGRPVLRDGYHRAYGLLKAGIRHVPALVRHFDAWDEAAMPDGLLPQSVCLGANPPLLPDYLDDGVAINRWVPAMRRLLVIQALDLLVQA